MRALFETDQTVALARALQGCGCRIDMNVATLGARWRREMVRQGNVQLARDDRQQAQNEDQRRTTFADLRVPRSPHERFF
jgi:hypothetical protein